MSLCHPICLPICLPVRVIPSSCVISFVVLLSMSSRLSSHVILCDNVCLPMSSLLSPRSSSRLTSHFIPCHPASARSSPRLSFCVIMYHPFVIPYHPIRHPVCHPVSFHVIPCHSMSSRIIPFVIPFIIPSDIPFVIPCHSISSRSSSRVIPYDPVRHPVSFPFVIPFVIPWSDNTTHCFSIPSQFWSKCFESNPIISRAREALKQNILFSLFANRKQSPIYNEYRAKKWIASTRQSPKRRNREL